MKNGFDNEKYVKIQSEHIKERISKFGDKLYLEFGGKLFDDYHAARVLPGFQPDSKLKMLMQLADYAEIVIVISASDIEKNKIRGDLGITYDKDVLRLKDEFEKCGLNVGSVVITQFKGQEAAKLFRSKLKKLKIKTYVHYEIKGYPSNVALIDSDEGYGKNDYIETSKPLVVVTAPGPGSGKMATCLSQLYHDKKRGIKAGYAKFETFPIWNLPLKHPVNLAYEAATADLADVNMVDPFHLAACNETAINYNRDVEIFPVVRRICERIMAPEQLYVSPTDMGVNRVGFAITDDAVVREAATQEVIRRYFRACCDYASGIAEKTVPERCKLLMDSLGVNEACRSVVSPARQAAQEAEKKHKETDNVNVFCGAALELPDGKIITGKNSQLLHAATSCVLNAIKYLADLPDDLHLLPQLVIDSVGKLKQQLYQDQRISLTLNEALIALSVSEPSNPAAQLAMSKLTLLKGCQMHFTHIVPEGDLAPLRKLGITFTCDPVYTSKNLFME